MTDLYDGILSPSQPSRPHAKHLGPEDVPVKKMPKDGDQFFCLKSGAVLGGQTYMRADLLVVTDEMIQDSYDRFGYSALWEITDPDAQKAKHGQVVWEPISAWPEGGIKPWESTDDPTFDVLWNAEADRINNISDFFAKQEAYQKFRAYFGPKPQRFDSARWGA